MRKTREYECPHCGEYGETDRTLDFDSIDIAADANGDDYEFISQYCTCGACGHHWTEYLRLTYDGCFTDGRVYDKNGVIADPEEYEREQSTPSQVVAEPPLTSISGMMLRKMIDAYEHS